MIPRPCFEASNTVYFQFCYMFARSDIYFRLHLLLIIITTACISLSLSRTSAPIHLTSVLGVLGTQETFCIVIVGLLERDSFDLFLPEFDKPWVIHLRETCYCSTNLYTWRPNTVYKNKCMRRHHVSSPKEICWGPTIYYCKQNKRKLKAKLKTLQEKHIVHEAIKILCLERRPDILSMKKGCLGASQSFDACTSWIFLGVTWESPSLSFCPYFISSHHSPFPTP
jgi:hypothetical protein